MLFFRSAKRLQMRDSLAYTAAMPRCSQLGKNISRRSGFTHATKAARRHARAFHNVAQVLHRRIAGRKFENPAESFRR